MTDTNNPGERAAYANGYGDCRRKLEERPEFNNWNGKPLGEMSRGEMIDALAWCVTELRKERPNDLTAPPLPEEIAGLIERLRQVERPERAFAYCYEAACALEETAAALRALAQENERLRQGGLCK